MKAIIFIVTESSPWISVYVYNPYIVITLYISMVTSYLYKNDDYIPWQCASAVFPKIVATSRLPYLRADTNKSHSVLCEREMVTGGWWETCQLFDQIVLQD